jgi:hypothetical protein
MYNADLLKHAQGLEREETLLKACKYLTRFMAGQKLNKRTVCYEVKVIKAILTRDYFAPGISVPDHIKLELRNLNTMLTVYRKKNIPLEVRIRTDRIKEK